MSENLVITLTVDDKGSVKIDQFTDTVAKKTREMSDRAGAAVQRLQEKFGQTGLGGEIDKAGAIAAEMGQATKQSLERVEGQAAKLRDEFGRFVGSTNKAGVAAVEMGQKTQQSLGQVEGQAAKLRDEFGRFIGANNKAGVAAVEMGQKTQQSLKGVEAAVARLQEKFGKTALGGAIARFGGDIIAAGKLSQQSLGGIEDGLVRLKERFGQSGLGGAIGKIGGWLTDLKTLAVAALTGWGIKQLADDMLQTGSTMDRLRISLDTVTKGGGDVWFEKLNTWALKMPVNTEKAIASFVQMRAMGLKPTIDQMTTLVDTTSALGGQSDTLEGIARAMGQIQTKGKLSMEETLQLAERGVPVFEILREKLGLTQAQMGNLGNEAIDANKAIAAIFEGLAERFGGQSAKVQGKFAGLIESLKGYWTDFSRLVMGSGVMAWIEAKLGGIVAQIDKMKADGTLQTWAAKTGAAITGALDSIYKTGQRLVAWWREHGEAVKENAALAWELAKAFGEIYIAGKLLAGGGAALTWLTEIKSFTPAGIAGVKGLTAAFAQLGPSLKSGALLAGEFLVNLKNWPGAWGGIVAGMRNFQSLIPASIAAAQSFGTTVATWTFGAAITGVKMLGVALRGIAPLMALYAGYKLGEKFLQPQVGVGEVAEQEQEAAAKAAQEQTVLLRLRVAMANQAAATELAAIRETMIADRDALQKRQGEYRAYIEQTQALLKQATDEEKRLIKEVSDLYKQKFDLQVSTEEQVRRLRELSMSDLEKYNSQMQALNDEAARAMALTGQEQVNALEKYKGDLAGFANTWSKGVTDQTGAVLQSGQGIVDAAIAGLQSAGAAQQQTLDAMAAAKEEQLAANQAWSEQLRASLQSVESEMTVLAGAIAQIDLAIKNLPQSIVVKAQDEATEAINRIKARMDELRAKAVAPIIMKVITMYSAVNAPAMAAAAPTPDGSYATGTEYTPRPGLYRLHRDELYIPPTQAALIRAAAPPAGGRTQLLYQAAVAALAGPGTGVEPARSVPRDGYYPLPQGAMVVPREIAAQAKEGKEIGSVGAAAQTPREITAVSGESTPGPRPAVAERLAPAVAQAQGAAPAETERIEPAAATAPRAMVVVMAGPAQPANPARTGAPASASPGLVGPVGAVAQVKSQQRAAQASREITAVSGQSTPGPRPAVAERLAPAVAQAQGGAPAETERIEPAAATAPRAMVVVMASPAQPANPARSGAPASAAPGLVGPVGAVAQIQGQQRAALAPREITAVSGQNTPGPRPAVTERLAPAVAQAQGAAPAETERIDPAAATAPRAMVVVMAGPAQPANPARSGAPASAAPGPVGAVAQVKSQQRAAQAPREITAVSGQSTPGPRPAVAERLAPAVAQAQGAAPAETERIEAAAATAPRAMVVVMAGPAQPASSARSGAASASAAPGLVGPVGAAAQIQGQQRAALAPREITAVSGQSTPGTRPAVAERLAPAAAQTQGAAPAETERIDPAAAMAQRAMVVVMASPAAASAVRPGGTAPGATAGWSRSAEKIVIPRDVVWAVRQASAGGRGLGFPGWPGPDPVPDTSDNPGPPASWGWVELPPCWCRFEPRRRAPEPGAGSVTRSSPHLRPRWIAGPSAM